MTSVRRRRIDVSNAIHVALLYLHGFVCISGVDDGQLSGGTMVTGAQSVALQNVADICLTTIPCNPRARYRSFDGSCNNLQQPGWGSVNTALVRLLPAAYQDGEYTPYVIINVPRSRGIIIKRCVTTIPVRRAAVKLRRH